jgi:hypothetical protein
MKKPGQNAAWDDLEPKSVPRSPPGGENSCSPSTPIREIREIRGYNLIQRILRIPRFNLSVSFRVVRVFSSLQFRSVVSVKSVVSRGTPAVPLACHSNTEN